MPADPASRLLVRRADLHNPQDAAAYRDQLNHYAADPMGSGRPLPQEILRQVTADLAQLPHAHAFLAFVGRQPVGFATCFGGYSTFRARPLWNIHDIAVLAQWRGRGIGAALIRHIADQARAAGCCKLTLEVREDNPSAAALYRREGFRAAAIGAREVQYLFLEKALDGD